MKNFLNLAIFFYLFICAALNAVNIAITFDDYPMPDGYIFSKQERIDRFLAVCANHKCKVVFFCIGENCKENISSLNQVNDSGHFLANHSMVHHHLSSQSLSEFEAEIIKTDSILSPYENMRKWFRYPFLDYGNRYTSGGSSEKAFDAFGILKKLNYVEGYVTMNNFDWHINERLQLAILQGKKIDYEALKKLYISLLKKWCLFYIHLYKNNFSEEVPHTLLLHANDLNALYLDDIFQMIHECG